jgi:hypothetical protein
MTHLKPVEKQMPSHLMAAYWNGSRYELPPGASWTQAVYDAGTGPQTSNVVQLAGETNAETGEAWRAELEAERGYPVRLLVCSDDDARIELVRLAGLVEDAIANAQSS